MGWSIEAIREVPVEPGAIFALYVDPATWPAWGHNATWARADGPLAEGGTVDVRASYGKVYPCRIRRLVPDRALELVVRPPGMTIVNVYEVEPIAEGRSLVRHALQIEGVIGTIARLIGLGRLYTGKLKAEVEAVARLAAIGSSEGDLPV